MGEIKNNINTFIKAILAGIMIGIGAIIYLSCTDKIIGSFLFAIGLFVIISFEFNLYTGKIGYMNNLYAWKHNWLYILLIWLGNFVGTFTVGSLICFTRLAPALCAAAQAICTIKLADNFISLLILAFFCGMLMYTAVEGSKIPNHFGQVLIIFLCVMVFILCGFEHCIANMAYITIAGMWSWEALGAVGIMTLGNSLGGLFIPIMKKIIRKLETSKT